MVPYIIASVGCQAKADVAFVGIADAGIGVVSEAFPTAAIDRGCQSLEGDIAIPAFEGGTHVDYVVPAQRGTVKAEGIHIVAVSISQTEICRQQAFLPESNDTRTEGVAGEVAWVVAFIGIDNLFTVGDKLLFLR